MRKSIFLLIILILNTISIYSSNKYNMNGSKFYFMFPGPNDTICSGDTVTLSASNPFALSYVWSPGYNISSLNIANPKVYPSQTTTYHVTIYGITNNLINNGDFSQGNTGFSSGYTYTTNLWPEATYYIGSNPLSYHPNFASCGDHTTGNGNMMIVNGAAVPNTNIWQKTVNVNPNAMYVFSCWLASVTPTNPAQLQFFVNGVQIGAVFNATSINCNWNMFYNLWPSGTATTANIAIKNQNSQLSGNDFAIDDIYFAEMVEIYDSTKIVVEKPSVSLGNDTAICQGDTIKLSAGNTFAQYLWSNNAVTSSINVTAAGNYWVKVTSAKGCKASDTINLNINPKPLITTINDSICKGDTAILSASGGNKYLWSTGDSTQNILVNPNITTNYKVVVKTNAGCIDSAFAKAVVFQKPLIGITSSQTICEGSSAIITANGGINYLWNNGATTPTINVSPLTNTTYSVDVTDNHGCKNDTSTTVSIIQNPIATIVADIDSVCIGNPVVLSAFGGNTFHWNNGDNTSSITVYPNSTTNYSCTVSNTNNGVSCSNTTSYEIYAENCNTLYIPNAFVPIGINKIFKPIGNVPLGSEYYFSIFNRWGQLIFETENYETGWDGSYNGKLVQSGVYVYYIRLKFAGQKSSFEKTGIVSLIE